MANRKDSRGKVLQKGEHERADGTYHYTWLDSVKKRHYLYAKTLPELREKDIQKDILDGIDTTGSKTTLNQLFKMHMELKNDLRDTTRANYERMWKNCVETSGIGDKRISDIKRDAREKIPLSEDEIKKLIEFCNNSGTYSIHVPFLTIAIGTCLRCGELTGLTWSDIDTKNCTISINHQLMYKNLGNGCKFHISEPKTDAGKRTIPMTEAVHKAFIEIRKQNLILGRRSNSEVDGYSDFVFVSGNGQPFAINAVNSFLLNIEKAYNKQHPEDTIPHLSAHILRHTGCTLLASAGLDIKALQSIMGHSDVSITMNVYNHSSFERTEKEIQRIDNVVNF